MLSRTLDLVLRNPREVARRCHAHEGLRDLALVSVAAILVGGGVFGAVVGSFRDAQQATFAGIKLPITFLLALAVSVPAFYAFAGSREGTLTYRGLVALVLGSAARACLALGAMAPFLWLAIDGGLSYHQTSSVAVVMYGVAGLAALSLLVRGLGTTRPMLLFGCIAVFCVASAQSAWVLRPFLGRPSQASIPFVRAPEGDYVSAIFRGAESATARDECESHLNWVDACEPDSRCLTCPDGSGRRVRD